MTRILSGREITKFKDEGLLLLSEVYTPRLLDTLDELIHDKMTLHEKRDLHRKSVELSKQIFSRDLSEMVHQVTEATTIRIAATQVFDTPYKTNRAIPGELFCAGPLIAFAVLYLEDFEDVKRGDLRLISASKSINLALLGTKSLLLGFGGIKLKYVRSELDPISQSWLRSGIHYGDLLPANTHPVIFNR